MPHAYQEKSKVGHTVTKDVRARFRGCFHYGKRGHKWQRCFKRKRRIQLLWNLNLCWREPAWFGHVWVAKKNLYERQSVEPDHIRFRNSYKEANNWHR
ncbi:unnamed protein product [Arabis nemorensis]|uniref:Uncharacterized protein n=1 Tax=Arabis nemorensis TaxID=586526 RepID=A0A565BT98_9BRAS|nr:unnamed protein product [Arabis nemorensis]